jgi:hypothetical protein
MHGFLSIFRPVGGAPSVAIGSAIELRLSARGDSCERVLCHSKSRMGVGLHDRLSLLRQDGLHGFRRGPRRAGKDGEWVNALIEL